MSPNEAWQKAIEEGWEPQPVTSFEADDLFRPEVVATTIRGEVRLHNHLYFSRELTEFTGDKVRVGYDIHDASKVWVRDMSGRLICIAEFEANKRAYFPEAFVDQAQRRRTEQRANRLEMHLQEVREELDAPALLEHQRTITVPTDIPKDRLTVDGESIRVDEAKNVIALPGMEERPWFTNDPDQYRWLMRNPAQWSAEDAVWLIDYVGCEDYAELADRYAFQGVAWGNEDEARAKARLEGFEVAAG